MWDEEKSKRFQELREREWAKVLTEAEKAELTEMIEELETLEAATLAPSAERQQWELERLRAQNEALRDLIHRRASFLARVQRVLETLQAEKQALDLEFTRIMDQGAARPKAEVGGA